MSEQIKGIKDLIQAILKSKKLLRMYPSNNPIYSKTLEENFAKFTNVFHYFDSIPLKIKQNEILFDAEQVYSSTEKEDNLALYFFKDGLREVSFVKGLDIEEMEEFIKIISLDFDREAVDDDIVTLLWEKDFQHIRYVVDETFLAEEEDYESQAVEEVQENPTLEENLQKAYEDAFADTAQIQEPSIINISDKDLKMLLDELEKDSQDKSEKVFTIVLSIFLLADSKEEYPDIVELFRSAIEYAMQQGHIPLITDLLKKMKRVCDDKNFNDDMRKHARLVLSFAGSNKIISSLGGILDTGQELDEKIFRDYLSFLERNAIQPFIQILGELESIHARKIVIEALVHLGPKDLETLARGLNDSRWYVVRNIIFILRKIGDKRAVDYLLKTVNHDDIRVKKEVIRTLGELGSSNVIVALRDCLVNADPQVRSAARKALGGVGSESAKRIVMERISDKSFKDNEFDEKKEYFEVLSQWSKDSEVFEFLLKTVRKGSFWGGLKHFEKRACAAYALGLSGRKDAVPVLNKLKGSGNKLLRECCSAAIRRIGHGQ